MVERTAKPQPAAVELTPHYRRIEKPWGWEVIWAESASYSAKLIHVLAGRRLSLQYHDSKTETQCLLAGNVLLVVEDAAGDLCEIPMQPHAGYTIGAFQVHRLIAIEDSELVEVSTPERGTTVRVEDDYQRGDETEQVRAQPQRGWSTAGEAS